MRPGAPVKAHFGSPSAVELVVKNEYCRSSIFAFGHDQLPRKWSHGVYLVAKVRVSIYLAAFSDHQKDSDQVIKH